MPKTKVEVYDKDQLIYPYIESDHVTFSNGMKVSEMLDQSISMPTVIHEDLSFKVGVGDQDVSSAIVDSSVSEMTIKGKTYQNILPEPSTHVLINNKEMFKVNEGLDPNVEVVDGVSKSAILKGNTLVNIYKITESTPYTYKNGSSPSSKLTVNLLANKTYLILLDFSTVNKDGKSIINFFPMSTFIDGTKKQESNFNIDKNGRFTYKYTPTKDVKEYAVIIGQNNFEQNNPTVVLESAMIIEYQQGMENWNIPYFEGMQSVKMPILSTTGKNLLPPVKNTWYPCRFKQGTTFKLSTKDSVPSNGGNVVFKDINGTSIWFGIDSGNTTSTKVLPCDVYYISNSLATGVEHQLEIGKQVTSYEPYKTNILHTPEEVVLRSLPNGVCDTLNLNTGEYVQRTREIVLNGSENWGLNKTLGDGSFNQFVVSRVQAKKVAAQLVNCDKLISDNDESVNNRIWIYDGTTVVIHSSCRNVDELKTWLQQNPLTVQYELATPAVKTVDLSTSGNWEKIVLDGSERWESRTGGTKYAYTVTNVFDSEGANGFCDTFKFIARGSSNSQQEECVASANTNNSLSLFTNNEILSSVGKLKEYLQSNPITVWYQTQTHKDSTQVKQPMFFKDGHIIQSSGADNSLIPTLDYQAKTSNSYVMDLMKTNTKYTMKAKSASGTFTIDGTSYGAGTNGTFTTPTSMTNKFLVMSNKTNEEVMILEGDVVSKTIPYFKGIKSAFEDEGKIEVLSQGKNLITDVSLRKNNGAIWDGDVLSYSGTSNDLYYTYSRTEMTYENAIKVKVGSCYEVGLEVFSGEVNVEYSVAVATFDKDLNVVRWLGGRFVVQQGEEYVGSIRLHGVNAVWTNIKFRMWMEEVDISSNVGAYEPYKSNNTKIPLLSPLRSLPNGVYDEIILDRESNKATLIQRVGYVMLNGSEEWNLYPSMEQDKTLLFQTKNPTVDGKNAYCVSDKYFHSPSLWSSYYNEGIQLGGGNPISRVDLRIYKGKVSSNNATILREYLSKDPIVVLYELATPIITEVDLEGFPYIYKDGHIFLNSKIVPTTEIIYSINQCQQISASNEDIIRHEKELTYLQKLIAQYVQVDYESALLSLKV